MNTSPKKPLITVVTPCYNEEANVLPLVDRIRGVFKNLPEFEYEHLFIDNASTDQTVEKIREIARTDSHIKAIVNVRNFGHIRSPFYALLQARGDAVVLMASDLQDPPELITTFLEHWKKGIKVVMGVKHQSEESAVMFRIRKMYYYLINRLSEVELVKNFTGFGLYDQSVIERLREINDPYPYFRGLIADLGYESVKVYFKQAARKRGITKNNFYTLYDIAMLGITNHSKVPLRLATLMGFVLSAFSFFVAIVYLVAKLVFWEEFRLGTAPILIGVFLFSSVQLFFIGIIGEYLGSIHTQILRRPLVIEKERIGF